MERHVLAVGQTNNKTVEQLRRTPLAAVSNGTLATEATASFDESLESHGECQAVRQHLDTVFHDFIGPVCPFFVHVRGINVDLLLVFLFWEQQASNE